MARSSPPRRVVLAVTVTPRLAELWMGDPSGRQKVERAKVTRFVDMMRGGDWTVDAEPVRVGSSGRVRDGWHRLHAVVEHGDPVVVAVLVEPLEG